jgi:uncharacterized protein DUF6438
MKPFATLLRTTVVLVSISLARPPLQAQDPLLTADSVVLERTLCFGTCPAYRLRAARNGVILFESRNPGDQGRRGTGKISELEYQRLLGAVLGAHFLELPDSIAGDARFCRSWYTDAATATVTVFMPDRVKRVVDYLGCFWAPAALRDLETRIDQSLRSNRWVRPAPSRWDSLGDGTAKRHGP